MKKFLVCFSLLAILIIGVVAGADMGKEQNTYNPENGLSVYELMEGTVADDDEIEYSGAADAIVQQNLENTHSINDVTSIVFDFRGYDTMGEAFILAVAVAGSIVILSVHNKKEEGNKDEKR